MQGKNTDKIQEEVRFLGDEVKDLEEKQNELDEKQRNLLLNIPNIPDETTPIGASDADNVEGCFICQDKRGKNQEVFYFDKANNMREANFCPNCGRKISG